MENVVEKLDSETLIAAKNDIVPIYFDPLQSQCKGRKKRPIRFKTTLEKKSKKITNL
jgi:hypothetical protein